MLIALGVTFMRALTYLLSASAFTSFAATAWAQEECKSIADDDARLACYDTTLGVATISDETGSGMGKWQKSTEVSELTDDKNVFVHLDSEDTIRGPYGGEGRARIWLRCMENTTAVILHFNDHFMSDIQGFGKVEYRLDEESLSSINASASTDNKALGLWSGSQAIPFIKRMLGKERLIVRATPYSESRLTVTFDIRGVDEATTELRETCNW